MELEIGQRFKEYERAFWQSIPPRMPVVVRLDGRAFHTLTKRMKIEKPFDEHFADTIRSAALNVCREFHPVFSYVQSDELSMLLLNDREHGTQPVFGNDLPKILSISASTMASHMTLILASEWSRLDTVQFDSRASIVPESDVINYFVWRQIDCQRNARNLWSECTLGREVGMGTARKMLRGNSGAEQVNLVEGETGETYSDSPAAFRLGTAIYRRPGEREWIVDSDLPWFANDRRFIQDRIDAYYA